MAHRYHNSFDPACKAPFGAVEAEQKIEIRLYLPAGQSWEDPLLHIYEADKWHQPAATVGLQQQADAADGTVCLGGSFSLPLAGLYFYCFELTLNGSRCRILRGEGGEGFPGEHGGLWQITVCRKGFATPDRFKGGVMYQIFPDRFSSSGKMHPVPAGRELHARWGETPKFLPDMDGEYRPNDFFGGDLKGIRDKLGYLESLGVTTIYLNPIFEAHSNHRYNTADYRKIDPMLGTEQDLCAEAARRGILIILDGVFSHTGSDSIYFNREGRYDSIGAWQSKESPYYSWFNFKNYPEEYESWWGFKTLPEVKETDPGYLEFICGRDGVLHKWLELGAAGWRLDVADELPDEFLDQLRRSVKAKDPEALVLGEVWEDASCKEAYGQRRRYLQGDQLDSVMNYPFRDAILDFVANHDSRSFLLRILEVVDHYPKCVCDVLMNFLSTHDVERALTRMVGEPANGRDRGWQGANLRLSPQQYRRGVEMLRIAALLQYTLPGLPCLYYGDEAGLYGYRDPFNRGCYPWGKEDMDLVNFFRRLGQFRRGNDVFAKGEFIPLSGSACCRYLRREGQKAVLVAVNADQQPCRVVLPQGFVPAEESFSAGQWQPETHTLGGCSGVILCGSLTKDPEERFVGGSF